MTDPRVIRTLGAFAFLWAVAGAPATAEVIGQVGEVPSGLLSESAPEGEMAVVDGDLAAGGESSPVAMSDTYTGADGISTASTEETADEEALGGSYFSVNYTNILYGPSVDSLSSYQPKADGTPDYDRPIFMKNFLSATYGINDTWALTATAYWWYRPVLGQELVMQDPFARISHSSLFNRPWGLNLYSDMRVHFGVTSASRDANLITGIQNFSYLTYVPGGDGPFLVALRASARGNIYGADGYGVDGELYLAPEANLRLGEKFAITLLYELGASHQVGDPWDYFTNDGTDLVPGIQWDPTPSLTINPYVTILTGGRVSWSSTSFGMFVTWNII